MSSYGITDDTTNVVFIEKDDILIKIDIFKIKHF